jgi:hypothetical protein
LHDCLSSGILVTVHTLINVSIYPSTKQGIVPKLFRQTNI